MKSNKKQPAIIQILDRAILVIALVGGALALIFMVFASTFNVLVMRKVMNAPIAGAEDLLILSLVILVALAIPLGGRTGSHIEIEVLESRMSIGFAKGSMILLRLVGSGLMFVMAYQLVHAGQKATKFGETTQQLLISYEPFYYLLALSAGLYGIILATDVYRLLSRGFIDHMSLGRSK